MYACVQIVSYYPVCEAKMENWFSPKLLGFFILGAAPDTTRAWNSYRIWSSDFGAEKFGTYTMIFEIKVKARVKLKKM